ncbi:hypothetical protein BTJ68_06596 [Hortaea werneckii EXF-2000]|uniref:Uncharacterized protein n=1 Tax=Hortaea werneckii EXF-2000 TaxID=1157616 RepID=A0A1Z5TIB2_HORWE|nr:hypothetical protein BTJ68_06596 [Hortaea werneckii EXF-2000]
MSRPTLRTPICSLLGIEYPILLAGMARTSSGPLAAAVSNAGGLGVIGGLGYTPDQLRSIIHEIKTNLSTPSLPFGVDLALPQVGGSARKTNHDYTHGQLDELISVVIEEKARLFVSAVGSPLPIPLRVRVNDYIRSWEMERPEEVKRLCESGTVPLQKDMDEDKEVDIPFLMGQVAGVIGEVKPAREIMQDMVKECVDVLQAQQGYLGGGGGRASKL